MGLLDRLRKPAPAEPSPPSKSKRSAAGGIVCSCGQRFPTEDQHHAHLHAEHPEHAH
jgi:hypothetical protein